VIVHGLYPERDCRSYPRLNWLLLRHRVDMKIERSAVAYVENARLIVAFEGVRRIAGQADIGRAIDRNLLSVTGYIGESAL
jgi:hypothetical protein